MSNMNQKNKVLVISGPTGSGKNTFVDLLVGKYPRFCRFITTTSRTPRKGEKNGEDYFFVTKEEFKKQICEEKLIEYTHIKNYDQYYGTYKKELKRIFDLGKIAILNVDNAGARFFKKEFGALTIFIEPESIEVLRQRVYSRDPNIPEDELEKRLANARRELENEKSFYKYSIVNKQGKLDEALREIISILKNEGYIS